MDFYCSKFLVFFPVIVKNEDRLYIIKPSEKNSAKFNEISEIKRMPEIDRKLFSVKLESGKNMGLYDRYLKEYHMNFIDFISVKSGKNILVPV